MITERSRFVDEKLVADEAQEFLDREEIDVIMVRGTGEPFLASNLHEITMQVRKITDRPIAAMTNASMLCRSDVIAELSDYDVAIIKIDAANEVGFSEINRPHKSVNWEKLIDSLRKAVRESKTDVRIQITMVKNNLDQVEAIAALCEDVGVEMVYLSTPTRGDQNELSKKELLEQVKFFKWFKVKTIFD